MKKLSYRPEIDGLRAFAVLAVIFFHAYPSTFPSGFLGVDVFFVISGYLITNIIYEDLKSKKFSFSFFYERRARRILPTLFLVVLISEIFSYFILMPEALESFSKSVLFTLSFISNIFFYKQTGYFDVASELKPLLHTWSLSVEEQFYLFYPLLCVFLFKKRVSNFGISLITLFIFCFVGAIFLQGVVTKDAFFYLLQTRLWEFLAGASAVVFRGNFERPTYQSNFLQSSISLLFLVLILVILFGSYGFEKNNFLQLVIVVLITSCFLLISNKNDFAGRIIASKYLVGIGLISFSAYLWHQPIFVFWRNLNIFPVMPEIYLLLIFFVFFVSYFSWKYVELPFRNPLIINQRTFLITLSAFALIISGFAIYAKYFDGLPNRYSPKDEVLNFLNEKNDCSSNEKKFQPCILGDLTKSKIGLLIVGDSHSKSIMPAFDALGKQGGLKVARLGAPGCPPLLGIYVLSGNGHDKSYCHQLAERQLDFAVDNKIDKVIFVARWAKYFDVDGHGKRNFYLGNSPNDDLDKDNSKKLFIDKFNKTIIQYQKLGIKVIVLAQVPEQLHDTKGVYFMLSRYQSLEDKNQILERYSVRTAEHNKLNLNFLNFLNESKVKKIALDSFFCDDNICRMGTVTEPYFKDQHHLSVVGAKNLMPTIREELFKNDFLR